MTRKTETKYTYLGHDIEGRRNEVDSVILRSKIPFKYHNEISLPRSVLQNALQLSQDANFDPNPTSYMTGPLIVPPQPNLYRGTERIHLDRTSYALIQARSPFRPESIVIPEAVARNFMIEDVKVGKNSQFLSVRPIPATLFSDKAVREVFMFQNLERLRTLTISVVNTTYEPQKFEATVTGSASSDTTNCRRTILGLGHTDFVAGETALITIEPFLEMELRRLVVPSHIAKHFKIEKILIKGLDGHIWWSTEKTYPASHFSENLPGRIPLHTLQNLMRGLYLSLEVTNTSKTPQTFTGALTGDWIS